MKPKITETGSIYMNTYENFQKQNRVSKNADLIFVDEIESIEVDNVSELLIIQSLASDFNEQWKSFMKSKNNSNKAKQTF